MVDRKSSFPTTIYQVPATIYIVGPTASGKSALAIWLAELHGNAEIVCADSQTVRRMMDIGTAKPTPEDQKRIRHHCLDLIDPYDDFSLHNYLSRARESLRTIHDAGKMAILVGGSGLYVDALYYNFVLPNTIESSDQNRQRYESMSIDELTEEIVDKQLPLPENKYNKRHLMNTLLRNGILGAMNEPKSGSVIIGLNPPKEVLWPRLLQRTEQMFRDGFLSEVEGIIARYGAPPKSFDAIAYRVAMEVIEGGISVDEAINRIHIAERQYAKRQITWFKRNEHILWFTEADKAKQYLRTICKQ
jgi:tRNA dimethylallyltransferase